MRHLPGFPASPGVAVGPAIVLVSDLPPVRNEPCDDPARERATLEAAVETVLGRLRSYHETAKESAGEEVAEIFETHQMFLDDPSFAGAAAELVETESIAADTAVQRVVDELAGEFEAIGDSYFAQRALDIRDLGQQLRREVLGLDPLGFDHITEPSVIVAHDLTPSETVTIPPGMALAFCTEVGSSTSHTAILARGLGVPAVVGVGSVGITSGTILAVDGDSGDVWADPDESTRAEFETRARSAAEVLDAALARAYEPAMTTDGTRVEVAANIGGPSETSQALEMGAEGVGLLRTEFLFLDREEPPDEDEQYEAYKSILEAMHPRPVVVRTLDIGGDKEVSWAEFEGELNPFLGVRGIRLTMAQPELLTVQLRALLRAGAGMSNLRVMFPMIGILPELESAKEVLSAVATTLDEQGIPRADDFQVGMMIEVPSAAILADVFAPHVDFFSIGTNDLTQYTLAADRTNPSVSPIADAFHPSVLRLVSGVIEAAHSHGKWVGMCGELAGDSRAVPVLLGLGLDEFSAAVPAVPLVKEAIREQSMEACRLLAEQALMMPTGDAVRALLSGQRSDRRG